MSLPAPIETIRVTAVEDRSARIATLQAALHKLRFRKQAGDEDHADRIQREIDRLTRGG